jgi:hypothetical protein
MKTDTDQNATYCPEDNKLRLYVGRVPRDEYLALKAEGWTSTPKQDCDFVAKWTPRRCETCLEYAEIIEDEDMEPAERAADRAERFSEYREKRTSEALGHADRYDSKPLAHGFQSEKRAQRAAARHDRIADHACDAWSKAEYWQHRTAGVISHALYVSTPSVRMGRIKKIEASQRKHVISLNAYKLAFKAWLKVAAIEDPKEQTRLAIGYAGDISGGSYSYHHPRPESGTSYNQEHGTSIYSLLTQENDPITGAEAAALWLKGRIEPGSEAFEKTYFMRWARHYELRLAYENQMLEAQGGRAAMLEMEIGGWIGSHQIRKVNKSNATGRVVSVSVMVSGQNRWDDSGEGQHLEILNIERLSQDSYRAPTEEDKAALKAEVKAKKAAAPKKAACPLINPTDEEAQRLQTIIYPEKAVQRLTQAVYSANSKGAYARFETKCISGGGHLVKGGGIMRRPDFPAVCKVRMNYECVIIVTDKPQKKLPASAWDDPRPAVRKEVLENAELLQQAASHRWSSDMTEEETAIFTKARSVRFAYMDSLSQFGVTDEFRKSLAELTTV